MRAWSRVIAFVLVAALAFWFTIENSRELVSVDLVLFRVRASLPLVVFGSMLAGMLAVFLVGLRADLQTRRLLTRYREVMEGRPAGPPPADRIAQAGDSGREGEGRPQDRARLDALDPT